MFTPNDPPPTHQHHDCPHTRLERPTDFRGFAYDYIVCLQCGDRQHDNFNDQT